MVSSSLTGLEFLPRRKRGPSFCRRSPGRALADPWGMKAIAFVLASIFAIAAQANEIHVTRAVWGSHDVTAKAASFCDGKNECEYKIHPKYVGDVGKDTYQAFILQYKCSTSPQSQIKVAMQPAGKAFGSVISLSCPMPPLTPEQVHAMFGARTATFRQMLRDPDKGQYMRAEIGSACTDAINALTASGRSLRSEKLVAAEVPLRSIHFASGQEDDTFYHWTSDPGLINLFHLDTMTPQEAFTNALKNHLFESMFDFLRKRQADNYAFWRRVFYVAEDTESSAFLGNHLIEFDLDLNARTIQYDQQVWADALAEVAHRYPTLAANCKMGLDEPVADTFGAVMFNNLFFIIAEDSGVEVVDYNQQEKWFQILSPTAFRGVRLVK